MTDTCITCEREFKQMMDYPLVLVKNIVKGVYRSRMILRSKNPIFTKQRAIMLQHIDPYVNRLETLVGKEVPPHQLLTEFPRAINYSRRVDLQFPFSIPGTDIRVGFKEQSTDPKDRSTHIPIYADNGPGCDPDEWTPTASWNYMDIARIEYEGRLKNMTESNITYESLVGRVKDLIEETRKSNSLFVSNDLIKRLVGIRYDYIDYCIDAPLEFDYQRRNLGIIMDTCKRIICDRMDITEVDKIISAVKIERIKEDLNKK